MKISITKVNSYKTASIMDFNWKRRKLTIPIKLIKLRDNSQLIGCCYVSHNWIFNLVVNPKFRGNNYGKIIVDAACKEIWKTYNKVMLTPQDNEPKLRKYYSSLGFSEYSKSEKGYEEEDKTWWAMWKNRPKK